MYSIPLNLYHYDVKWQTNTKQDMSKERNVEDSVVTPRPKRQQKKFFFLRKAAQKSESLNMDS